MPTFKISRDRYQNTFEYFCHENNDISTTALTTKIVKIIIFSFFNASCVYMIEQGWSDMMYYHYHNTYSKHHLYYLQNWVGSVVSCFVSLLFILHVFMNEYRYFSLKYNAIVTFIICIIINGTFVTLLLWQYEKHYNSVWYFEIICNHLFTKNTVFQHACKFQFSMIGLWIHVIDYPMCLFLVIMINHLIFRILKQKKFKVKHHSSDIYKQEEYDDQTGLTIKRHDQFRQSLIININSTELEMDNEIYDQVNWNSHLYSFCLHFAFIWTLLIFFLLLFFNTEIFYFYTTNINYYFYFLLISTSFVKLIFKWIGRKMDIDNMNRRSRHSHPSSNNNNNNKWYHRISMEMFCEFFVNYVYFQSYYDMFIYELSSSTIDHVLLLIVQHLISESVQSIVRSSQWYFTQTTKLQKKFENYCDKMKNKNVKNFAQGILNKLDDQSNLNQWKIRHSIDSTIRFVGLFCAFVYFTIQFNVIPHDHWRVSNKSDYYNALFYFCLSFSCDLIYFLLWFVFNYYCNSFNALRPFVCTCVAHDINIIWLLLIMSVLGS